MVVMHNKPKCHGLERPMWFFPIAGLRSPTLAGGECSGQLIREGSMAEECIKYLLGSALKRGVGGGEGDSGGWRRDLTGESSRSHSGALVGSGYCHTGI